MNVSLFLLYCGPSCPDSSQQQEKQEDKLDTKLRDDFGPELDKIAKALSVVVGFESFGDYVFHCVRRDVNMFIQGGDEIDIYFGDAYRHLVHQPIRGILKGEHKQAGVIRDEDEKSRNILFASDAKRST